MTYNYTGITIDKYMSNNRTSKDCSYVECVYIHISYTRKVFLVLYITNFIFYRKKDKKNIPFTMLTYIHIGIHCLKLF